MSPKSPRHHQKVSFLESSALFADLHADEIELLADLCQEETFEAGEEVVVEGEGGDSVYIVEEGEAVIVRGTGSSGEAVLATLKVGEFFGEMSVIDRSPRSATVRAVTRLRCLTLSTEDLYSFARIFMNGFTLVVINIARTLSHRLRTTNNQLMSDNHPR